MEEMQMAAFAWDQADSAINAACSALGEVPGAGDEWIALCGLAGRFQAEARTVIDRAWAGARRPEISRSAAENGDTAP